MRSFVLDLSYLHFPARKGGWWKDTRKLDAILRACVESGLGVELGYLEDDSGEYRAAPPLPELVEQSKTWGDGGHVLSSAPQRRAGATLDLTLMSDQLRLMLLLNPELVAARPDALDRMVALVERMHAALGPGVLWGKSLALRATGMSWTRPRPPSTGGGWTVGAFLMFVSRRYHEKHDPESLAKLLAAPLPAGATREERGDLVVFRFTQTLERSELRATCERQDAWISSVLSLPIRGGWNELGDELLMRPGLAKHGVLTFYDSTCAQGYQATVVGPDGEHDEELFAELAAWLSAGALPDGTRLSALHLIVPTRAGALAARAPADRAGITDIFYVDAAGQYWNAFPSTES